MGRSLARVENIKAIEVVLFEQQQRALKLKMLRMIFAHMPAHTKLFHHKLTKAFCELEELVEKSPWEFEDIEDIMNLLLDEFESIRRMFAN